MSRRPELAPINPPDRPLQSGGGGGTFDGMEARVAALETHVGYIRRDIGEFKADVSEMRRDIEDLKVGQATLTERVNHLPSKGFIFTIAIAIVGATCTFIALQDHIKALLTH